MLVLSALGVALIVACEAYYLLSRRADRLQKERDLEARRQATLELANAAQLDNVAGARLTAFRVTDGEVTFAFGFPVRDHYEGWRVGTVAEVTVERAPGGRIEIWKELP